MTSRQVSILQDQGKRASTVGLEEMPHPQPFRIRRSRIEKENESDHKAKPPPFPLLVLFLWKCGSASPTSSSIVTPSDQRPRELKSAAYLHPIYTKILAIKGSFLKESDLGITDTSKILCRTLLEAEQSIPQDTLFRDDRFLAACESINERNEAMIVRDISPLICPSAQFLRIYGAKHLKPLYESANEGWNSAIPFYGPRPQPDYSVGFNLFAFTDIQREKLKPFVGELTDVYTSCLMATWQICFPFLTSEVKCGIGALEVADRQNAHSMTLAVRGIVELFKLVKREKELHREILAFSISHDDKSVRIYGHYPIIDEKSGNTTFCRHMIRDFGFSDLDGKEKWTAYKFTKNIYDLWMPTHLERICSIIDDLPSDINFDVSQGSESHNLFEEASYNALSLEEADSQLSSIGSRDATPDIVLSQRVGEEAFKRPK
ncbi:hypothetical protein SBOR_2128 [Sclerotinia borealis F-4128]|uniref:DUF7924 domain-containing protein n=1 Tax=Sclerotinia borealis (strain F-4128) TaxID=1432307 RepID=W9CS83_SCLBF|nr:hypothetical protein SBOR_2128 [Sclerotinia borealis F-4128]